jgi:hypothetical protein
MEPFGQTGRGTGFVQMRSEVDEGVKGTKGSFA